VEVLGVGGPTAAVSCAAGRMSLGGDPRVPPKKKESSEVVPRTLPRQAGPSYYLPGREASGWLY